MKSRLHRASMSPAPDDSIRIDCTPSAAAGEPVTATVQFVTATHVPMPPSKEALSAASSLTGTSAASSARYWLVSARTPAEVMVGAAGGMNVTVNGEVVAHADHHTGPSGATGQSCAPLM